MLAIKKLKPVDEVPSDQREYQATIKAVATGEMSDKETEQVFKNWRFMTGCAESSLLTLIAPSFEKVTALEAAGVRERLGFEQAGELEKMMIDRIVLCWLRVLYAEEYLSGCLRADSTMPQVDCADRLLLRANTRLLRSIESFVRVKRLLEPEKPLATGNVAELFGQRMKDVFGLGVDEIG